MTITKFRVLIGNFSCKGLPAADSNGLSDPYIVGDFDNYRTFKTPKINKTLNPVWTDFSTQFFYETKYGRKLHLKFLKFDVYDHDMFSKDDYLGQAKIDLYTLATGPIHHELTLKDGSKDAGIIRFDVRMEEYSEVTVSWSSIRIQDIQFSTGGDNKNAINSFVSMTSINKKQQSKVKSEQYPDSKNPSWKSWPSIVFPEMSLRELLNDGVVMKLKHKSALKNTEIGTCTISFQKFFCNEDGAPVVVKGFFVDGSRAVVAKFRATATFTGLPAYAQMVKGENVNGVCTGTPLIPNAYVPDGYKEMTPPAIDIHNQSQPQLHRHYSVTSPIPPTNALPRANSMPPQQNVSPSTPYPASSSASIPVLPPGWEMKIHANGRSFYVDHNTRTTHWNPPTIANSPIPTTPVTTNISPVVYSQPATSSSELPLPNGWETRYDDRGRKYFVNHAEKKTQWENPREQVNKPTTLPPGWESRIDPATGKQFFIDHNTKTTHWTAPVVAVSSPTSPPVEKQLPPGWEIKYDDRGRRYFVNHLEKKTQWEDPRAA